MGYHDDQRQPKYTRKLKMLGVYRSVADSWYYPKSILREEGAQTGNYLLLGLSMTPHIDKR